jgi:hypothetical protein
VSLHFGPHDTVEEGCKVQAGGGGDEGRGRGGTQATEANQRRKQDELVIAQLQRMKITRSLREAGAIQVV